MDAPSPETFRREPEKGTSLEGKVAVVAGLTSGIRLGIARDLAASGAHQPSLAFATPEQIGAVAVFLCSDAAAEIRYGGWTA